MRHRHHGPEGDGAAHHHLCPPRRRAQVAAREGDVTSGGPAAAPSEAKPSDYGVMLTTAPSRDEAARLAQLLVDEKLAACVQLLPIESFYFWQGKTQNEPETLLLIKTRAALFETAIARIKAVHSYTVPEIVATRFTAGFQDYFSWIDDVTG